MILLTFFFVWLQPSYTTQIEELHLYTDRGAPPVESLKQITLRNKRSSSNAQWCYLEKYGSASSANLRMSTELSSWALGNLLYGSTVALCQSWDLNSQPINITTSFSYPAPVKNLIKRASLNLLLSLTCPLGQRHKSTRIYVWSLLWTWPGQTCRRLCKLNIFYRLEKLVKQIDGQQLQYL